MPKDPQPGLEVRAREKGASAEWEFVFKLEASSEHELLTQAKSIVSELQRAGTTREYAIFMRGKRH